MCKRCLNDLVEEKSTVTTTITKDSSDTLRVCSECEKEITGELCADCSESRKPMANDYAARIGFRND